MPGLYARWQVRFEQGEFVTEETVHRLLPPGTPLDESPSDVPLDDAWLLRAPPEGAGPWAPLPAALADARDVRELTRRWTAEVEMTAKVEGPDGWVYARRTRLVVVWVGAES